MMRNFASITSKQNDVSSDVYDNAFIVENGKIKFNRDIDMRMNKISNISLADSQNDAVSLIQMNGQLNVLRLEINKLKK